MLYKYTQTISMHQILKSLIIRKDFLNFLMTEILFKL